MWKAPLFYRLASPENSAGKFDNLQRQSQITDKAGYFSENKALLKAQQRRLTAYQAAFDIKLISDHLVEPAVKKQLTLHLQLIGKLMSIFA